MPMTNQPPNPENVRVLQERFLEGVKRVGTVSAGAREAGVSRSVAKRWIEAGSTGGRPVTRG